MHFTPQRIQIYPYIVFRGAQPWITLVHSIKKIILIQKNKSVISNWAHPSLRRSSRGVHLFQSIDPRSFLKQQKNVAPSVKNGKNHRCINHVCTHSLLSTTHLCQVWCERDHWPSCRQRWWWFWPEGMRRQLSGLPFLPLKETPAGSCPPERHGPKQGNTPMKRGYMKKAIHCRKRGFVNNRAPSPAERGQPSRQQLQWTQCSPSGSHNLHWCLSGDGGNEAENV